MSSNHESYKASNIPQPRDASDQPRAFGKYALQEQLDAGPFAELFKAEDVEKRVPVLLRIVSPIASQNPLLQKAAELIKTGLLAPTYSDPHVLRLLDAGTHEGRLYFAYEHFDGVALSKLLREQRPPVCGTGLDDGIAILRQTVEGLRSLHQRRIAHTDVKPANILVARSHQGFGARTPQSEIGLSAGTPAGSGIYVKLAPADLATSSADAMVSIYGEIAGTPYYMSPEQIAGECAPRLWCESTDTRSDIFALGLVAYELFVGKRPFDAASPLAYMKALAERDAPVLARADPSLPLELGRIVARMLSRDPRHRYRSCQSILDDLHRVEALRPGETIEAVPPGADSAFAMPIRPVQTVGLGWRITAVAAVAACVVLLVWLVSSRIAVSPSERPATPGPREPSRPASEAGSAPAPSNESPSPQPSKDETEFRRLMESVAKAKAAKQFDRALSQLSEYAAAHPGAANAAAALEEQSNILVAQAEGLAAARKYADALRIYREVRSTFPTSAHQGFGASAAGKAAAEKASDALYNWARQLLEESKPQEAAAKFEELISEFPRSDAAKLAQMQLEDALKSSADTFLAAGDYPQGVEVLNKLVALEANTPKGETLRAIRSEALTAWAEQYLGKQDLLGAYEKWALSELDNPIPDAAAAHPILAELAVVGNEAAAEARGRKGDLTSASLMKAWAAHLTASGKRAEAASWYRRIIDRYPDSPEGSYAAEALAEIERGDVARFINAGKLSEAREALKALAAVDPNPSARKAAAVELLHWDEPPGGMVYVPAGPFLMGTDATYLKELVVEFKLDPLVSEAMSAELPRRTVVMKSYYIDRTEVTNAQYKEFVEATPPAVAGPPSNADWIGGKVRPGAEANPVTGVTFADASAYAAWIRKRLPTEAEWEKAARGVDGRLYPWGNTFDGGRCNLGAANGKSVTPVARFPRGASIYGCLDMIGNVWEWTSSAYVPYEGNPRASGRALFDKNKKVVRGGSRQEKEPYMATCATRLPVSPDTRSSAIGFRCAMDVPEP